MRIAYFDCASGIAGDMTLGAMVDAGASMEAIQAGIDSLGLPSCRLESETVMRKGFRATKVHVRHEPEHAHRHLHHITDMITASALESAAKEMAIAIFTRLAEAEAKVHGTTLRKVHFHEVGAVDSIADIVGVSIGWHLLGIDRLHCSPIPTGSGFIQIAHGRTSVPAPATAELLRGIPLADSTVEAELTTPTGAAIVATLAQAFGPVPPMTIEHIGYGAGDKDFPTQANLMRLLIGNLGASTPAAGQGEILVLETNLDDTTGEVIGHCVSQLMTAGALDVYLTPIQMKKNRPAVTVTVLCLSDKQQQLESILFRETTTLGIRRWTAQRTTLQREDTTVETPWGTVAGKVATLPGGARRFSPEFDACQQLAQSHQLPIGQVMDAARHAYANNNNP
ncbi:MAG: nickel pincer cofactor biosynthesis protein LarC [Pirellulaceae bacterium]|nr:nickel pincer cofactor biosynthesis protein LarC [Planctomycetales bacterium]